MATLKKQRVLTQERLRQAANSIRSKYGPVLATRYYVVEHYPAVEPDHDSYGHPVRNIRRTEPTDERESHEAWIERHDPDPGASFHLRTENLREKTVREWVTW